MSQPVSNFRLMPVDNPINSEERKTTTLTIAQDLIKAQGDKKNDKRCHFCKKRIKLIGYSCSCGHVFCNHHHLPEEHKCNFDFRSLGRERLRANNPKIEKPKIEKF